ncbi:PREDICTED: heat shock 70 kDa protein 12B-like [Amphimedon queenslandica]|uniref:Uncharacterized protein n=1 Tax=Amphimedon queenslandica TaxID=400682 RepID=A0AAN0JKS3_AMPQE|nr:PREDICTED: heat shock 70 kDa protein 12B-like [Amphimedon queenslandica]|eukprot:XP_019857627.1 PREDICTED: heat shock 70 kDa protein 12B-like [Amphimedon queenslandica]
MTYQTRWLMEIIAIIAFILTHLKEKLLTDHLKGNYKSSDFDWAGLTSDAPGITRFTPVGSPLPRPEEVNPQKLSLALEPEVAAIAAQHQSAVSGTPPQRYMVVDIGGGTVDITVHDKSNGRISVVLPPMGNTWGGTTINEALSEKLQEAVDDKDFKVLLESDPISAKATLNRIFYEKFEEQKKIFGNATQGPRRVAFSLPRAFTRHYGNNIPEKSKKVNMHYNPENDSLTIEHNLLEEVFQFTINKILVCVRAAFDELTDHIDTVYLVGGFGGCRFVSQKIEEAIAQHRGMLYDNIVCPVQPDLAVVKGAVMWRKDPNIIQSRVADATYGVGVAPVFKPSIHDEHYKYVDEDGVLRCGKVFEIFVLKGEEIKDEVYKAAFFPRYQWHTQTNISIYCTADDGVQYLVDKEGELTVREIGQLILDLPNPDNVPRKERKYDVFMDFSGTEIQARAQYTSKCKMYKQVLEIPIGATVCDLLL